MYFSVNLKCSVCGFELSSTDVDKTKWWDNYLDYIICPNDGHKMEMKFVEEYVENDCDNRFFRCKNPFEDMGRDGYIDIEKIWVS